MKPRLFIKDIVERAQLQRFRDISRFSVVGGITTLGDFVIFSVLTMLLDVATIPANLVSYSCGIVASFLLNRNWTFSHSRGGTSIAGQGLRFAMTNSAGLLLSTALVALLAMVLPRPVAKILSIPIVFIWNYQTAKLWVFRRI